MQLSALEKKICSMYELQINMLAERVGEHVNFLSYSPGRNFPYSELWSFLNKIYQVSNAELQANLLAQLNNRILERLAPHHPKLHEIIANVESVIERLTNDIGRENGPTM